MLIMANIEFDESFTVAEYHSDVISDFTRRSVTYHSGSNLATKQGIIRHLLSLYAPVYPVLDIACGTGILGELLGNGKGVCGIDITKAMVDVAKDKCPEGEFVVGDAHKLKWEDRVFGCVYICSALVYFTDVKAVLKESMRVVKKGGFVAYQAVSNDSYVLGVALERAAAKVLGEEAGRYVFCQPHIITHDYAANEELMSSAGFEDIEIHKVESSSELMTTADSFWSTVVEKNGMLGRLRKVEDGILREIRGEWEVMIETGQRERVVQWYVCGRKK